MDDDTPVYVKIKEIMKDSTGKKTTSSVLASDPDFRRLLYWYLLSAIGGVVFLFINYWVSIAIAVLIASNARVIGFILKNKLSKIMELLETIQEESLNITYNKKLTDAINLLFHNNKDLREQGKDMIYTEFPEHSNVILSSERIFDDGGDEDDDDGFAHPVKVAARLN